MSNFTSIDSRGLKELSRKAGNIAKQFANAVKKPGEINKVLFEGGNKMRNFIITEMRNTKRAPWSYKATKSGKRHYPSLPGHFPAIDTGEGVRSIAFDTNVKPQSVFLQIGVTGGAPYLKKLEEALSERRKRPWLNPTVEKFKPQIMDDLGKIIPDNVNAWMITGTK
jgi:hypothetical protein